MSLGAVVPDGPTIFTSDGEIPRLEPSSHVKRCCSHCGLRKTPVTADDLERFPAQLSPRERRIIVLLCQGLTNKEIALRIETSEQVVKNTLRRTFKKVGCDHRPALLIRMMKFKYEGV